MEFSRILMIFGVRPWWHRRRIEYVQCIVILFAAFSIGKLSLFCISKGDCGKWLRFAVTEFGCCLYVSKRHVFHSKFIEKVAFWSDIDKWNLIFQCAYYEYFAQSDIIFTRKPVTISILEWILPIIIFDLNENLRKIKWMKLMENCNSLATQWDWKCYYEHDLLI